MVIVIEEWYDNYVDGYFSFGELGFFRLIFYNFLSIDDKGGKGERVWI